MRLIDVACREIYRAIHFAAGYRQTTSYNWRKHSTMAKNKKGDKIGGVPPEAKTDNAVIECGNGASDAPSTIEETLRLLKQGRRDLLPHLRWQMDRVAALWKHCGSLARFTQSAWATEIASGDDLVRESLNRVADQMRRELVSCDASAAEKLMAERVVLCWMRTNYYEQLEAQNSVNLLGTPLGRHVDQKIKSTNRQLINATQQLQRVRKLAAEISPHRPATALRLYDPAKARKTA